MPQTKPSLPPRTALEYAPRGLIGVLTPQGNTTVEPELAILLPPGYASINGRLTSPAPTMEARLIDYLEQLEAQTAQFANAPLDVLAFACTGASYLAGRDREDALIERIQSARGAPLVTAARAVSDALDTLGATRIALVSPYPAALTAASERYWRSRGFTVVEIASTGGTPAASFHPIYGLTGAAADQALGTLRGRQLDAIVMLGTGMPTLAPLLAAAGRDGPPVLSCMVALAWRCVASIATPAPAAPDLRRWIAADGWGRRLRERIGP